MADYEQVGDEQNMDRILLKGKQKRKYSGRVVWKRPYDVFINHHGCDTMHTLAPTIYRTLHLKGIRAFLHDQEELDLGDSLPNEIQEAIGTARLHIAIFSKRYAESAWCLAELSYMLQTGTRIIPVFYHVDPIDLRWAVQGKGCYSPAFSRHENKGRFPSNMLREWKMALQRVSFLSGHELRNIGDEAMLSRSIVNSVIMVIKTLPEQRQQKRMQIVSSSNSANNQIVGNSSSGNNQIGGSSGNNSNSSSVVSWTSAHHHGPPRPSAQTSEVNDDYVRRSHRIVNLASTFNYGALVLLYGLLLFNHPLIHRFANLASKFNWGALVFVLGSYGLVLSNPLFWMCWSILIIKAVVYNTVHPYWELIEGFTQISDESECSTRPHTAGAIILNKHCSCYFAFMYAGHHTETKYSTLGYCNFSYSI